MTEWSKVPVLKTGVLYGTVGSNPTLSIYKRIAQLVERRTFNPTVLGSIPNAFNKHTLEYGQVVRHRFLVPGIKGSNPFIPKKESSSIGRAAVSKTEG